LNSKNTNELRWQNKSPKTKIYYRNTEYSGDSRKNLNYQLLMQTVMMKNQSSNNQLFITTTQHIQAIPDESFGVEIQMQKKMKKSIFQKLLFISRTKQIQAIHDESFLLKTQMQ
jgi:hypothetical protein